MCQNPPASFMVYRHCTKTGYVDNTQGILSVMHIQVQDCVSYVAMNATKREMMEMVGHVKQHFLIQQT